jgi:hypothetical protein
MLVIKLISICAVIAVGMVLFYALSTRCEEVTRQKLLTAPAAYWVAAVAWAAIFGYKWRLYLASNGGNVLNGTVVIVLAAFFACGIAIRNFTELGAFYGAVRTSLQAVMLPVTVLLLPFYPLWLLWRRLSAPVPVRVVADE